MMGSPNTMMYSEESAGIEYEELHRIESVRAGRYDQPRDSRDAHELLYRYVTDWMILLLDNDQKPIGHIPLNPNNFELPKDSVLVGMLFSCHPTTPSLRVRFPAKHVTITIDRDPDVGRYRGYWFSTQKKEAWYRLLQPRCEHSFLPARVVLASISFFMHCTRNRHSMLCPSESIETFVNKNPVLSDSDRDLKILQYFKRPLTKHLLGARDEITSRCVLYKSLKALATKKTSKQGQENEEEEEEITERCFVQYAKTIENMLSQEPYGSKIP